MKMNAITMRTIIDGLIDRVNSPRYLDTEYYEAINLATTMIFEDRVDNIKIKKGYSFESVQRVRDELYTLIKNVIAAPSGGLIPYPADYNYAILVDPTVGGVTQSARPISYNEVALVQRNPFREPTIQNTFYIEQSNGINLVYSGGTYTQYSLWYLKNPDTVSIGTESDKIFAGATVLTISSVYIVYEEAVHAGTTYYPGDIFTATLTSLTSGIVILNSVIVNSDMPDKILPEICRLAGAILLGEADDYQKKQDLLNDNSKQ